MTHSTDGVHDFLPREEEQRLARRWRDHNDHKARDRIINAYHRMSVSFAMRASRPGLSLDDLIQEANIGLMSALDRFDPELGFGFGTFARYHVISRLQIYTLENVGPLRIFNTAATKTLISRYNRMRREWEERTGRQLDGQGREEICRMLEIDVEQLERFEMATSVPVSVDVGAGNPDEDSGPGRAHALADGGILPDQEALQNIAQSQTTALIDSILSGLPERDATIIRERLLKDPPSTLDRLSQRFGISRERVRQIELRTLKRIREALEARGIKSAEDLFAD